MTAPLQIAMALGSVGVLLGLMAVVRRVAQARAIGPEIQRKLIHIGTGLYALVLPVLFPDRWPVYLLVVLTLVVMLVLRLPNSRLGSTLHSVERQSYGDFLLAISVGVCLFLSGDQLYLYVLPIAVLTLADAAAALAGSSYGTKFFRIEEGEKSIEGSAVFFAVTLLISIICMMLMTPFAPANIIVLSAMVASFGTLIEATSWRGLDNLFLPVGLLIFLHANGASPLWELIELTVLFALSIVVFKNIAPRLGLTSHAAHVYVTAVFLLLASTTLQNTILPILVLGAHAWSRSAEPCFSKFPDLDIVAGLALVSFGSLVLGNAVGQTAISFYGMTVMGMSLGLSAIAVSARPLLVRFFVTLGIAVGLLGVRYYVVALNPDEANWNGEMWLISFLCLAVTGLIPLAIPQVFRNRRVLKLTLLALLIPAPYYLISTEFAGVLA